MTLKRLLIAGCAFLPLLTIRAGDIAPGFLEGHLKIISLKEVALAGGNPPKFTAENYAEYPLIVLSKDRQKEVARITPDRDGDRSFFGRIRAAIHRILRHTGSTNDWPVPPKP